MNYIQKLFVGVQMPPNPPKYKKGINEAQYQHES